MNRAALVSALTSIGIAFGQSTHQSTPTPTNPETLLKAAMDKCHAMKSLSDTSSWTATIPGGKGPVIIKRSFEYTAPNVFSLKMTLPDASVLKVVSDGKKLLATMSGQTAALSDAAPATIWDFSKPPLNTPQIWSLFYEFLGGSSNFDGLVDSTKGPVTMGAEQIGPSGEREAHVKFYAKGDYGHTDVLIGLVSNRIYSIAYDLDPLALQSKVAKPQIVENYSNIEANPVLADKDFDTTLPKGDTVEDLSAAAPQQTPDDKPPVPIGSPAPDVKVFSLKDGTPMKLSSLKGHVVMIDFWATWCPPCRESLPHTQDIYKNYAGKNVTVMTISDEEAGVIRDFIKDNKYTFPVYRDPGSESDKVYGITGIPTIVIIDATGKLSAFMVGLRDESDIVAALKKAGAN